VRVCDQMSRVLTQEIRFEIDTAMNRKLTGFVTSSNQQIGFQQPAPCFHNHYSILNLPCIIQRTAENAERFS
jgi:hypothetical protein